MASVPRSSLLTMSRPSKSFKHGARPVAIDQEPIRRGFRGHHDGQPVDVGGDGFGAAARIDALDEIAARLDGLDGRPVGGGRIRPVDAIAAHDALLAPRQARSAASCRPLAPRRRGHSWRAPCRCRRCGFRGRLLCYHAAFGCVRHHEISRKSHLDRFGNDRPEAGVRSHHRDRDDRNRQTPQRACRRAGFRGASERGRARRHGRLEPQSARPFRLERARPGKRHRRGRRRARDAAIPRNLGGAGNDRRCAATAYARIGAFWRATCRRSSDFSTTAIST